MNSEPRFDLYLGGRLVPGESGRKLKAMAANGEEMDAYCVASPADLQEAVKAARQALGPWAAMPASERCLWVRQLAGRVQSRSEELAQIVSRSHGVSIELARKGVATVVARMERQAARVQAYAAVRQPLGVVVVLAPDVPVMLPLVSLLLPVILGGNAAVVLPSERAPLPALTLAKVFVECHFPGGVVNILSGKRGDLAPNLAEEAGVDAIVDACRVAEISVTLEACAKKHARLYLPRPLEESDWFTEKGEDPRWINDTGRPQA
jgi:acyl-CoA reductase-like NAD-dependent aldehyde dehydrogenase